MTKISLRIEGVYDERTLRFLKSLGVDSFSFDFRPRSLFYLPQYQFQQMMVAEFFSKGKFSLHFVPEEKQFVIDHILNDLKQEREILKGEKNPFILEFDQSDLSVNEPTSSAMTLFRRWMYSPAKKKTPLPKSGDWIWMIDYPQNQGPLSLEEWRQFKSFQVHQNNKDHRHHNETIFSFSLWPWGQEKKIVSYLSQMPLFLEKGHDSLILSFALSSELESRYRHVDELKLGRWIEFLQEIFVAKSSSLSDRKNKQLFL